MVKYIWQSKGGIGTYKKHLREKCKEALFAVLPIAAIVAALSFCVAPMPSGVLLSFLFGAGLLIAGMMLFSLGAEISMEPIGQKVGAKVTKSKNIVLILSLGFLLGVMITVSEPDLQVLANQVASIPNAVLIGSVSAGVGLFLVLALLRMLLKIPLKALLWVFYTAVFLLAFFAPKGFRAVAFDAGGVTTGPMTVPFIMAFGLGVSAIRSDKRAYADSFGLVALCSVGPILAVLTLSLIYHPDSASFSPAPTTNVETSVELGSLFLKSIPTYLAEIAIALLPIALFFYVFQLVSLKLDKRTVKRITVGLLYTYAGLVLFLTGANAGFMPAGVFLGKTMASLSYRWIVIPIGMLIGYFIVKAEPAVYVLMKQVEELTEGQITGKSLRLSLSVGVAVSIGLSMVRVLTGVSVLWFLIPGYALALLLSLFVPSIFSAVAFDSGGVASGPMTAAFLLPFAVGACEAVGGDVVTDAFGVVAMVAMTPLISIQLLGLFGAIKNRKPTAAASEADASDAVGEYDVIEL